MQTSHRGNVGVTTRATLYKHLLCSRHHTKHFILPVSKLNSIFTELQRRRQRLRDVKLFAQSFILLSDWQKQDFMCLFGSRVHGSTLLIYFLYFSFTCVTS